MISLLVKQQLACGLRDRRFSVFAMVLLLLSALAGVLQGETDRFRTADYQQRSWRS